jgi:hypothetical protein
MGHNTSTTMDEGGRGEGEERRREGSERGGDKERRWGVSEGVK